MTEPKNLSEFSQLLNHETQPILMWYPICKYLSNWQETNEREEAVALATSYFEQRGETLNLGLDYNLSAREQRCESLLFIAEPANKTEELQFWLTDILAAYIFYEEDFPRDKNSVTKAVDFHLRLEVLLKKCASDRLMEIAQFIYSQRRDEYFCAISSPCETHEADYWMEPFLKFPELDINAFGHATLIWTKEGAIDFCLQATSLSLVEICRHLLEFENDKLTLHLSTNTDLTQLTTDINQLKNLQALNLQSLELYLSEINYLPAGICQLNNLQSLYINIPGLECLPPEISNLSNLKSLTLESIGKLKDLPAEFSELDALEELSVQYCGFLEVPQPIFELKNLKNLDIHMSSYMDRRSHFLISSRIGNLHQLQKLKISGSFIYALPDEISNLSALEELDLQCYYLNKLPNNIGNLHNLKELHFFGSKSITSLPDSLSRLTNLQTLTLMDLRTGHIPEVLFKMPFLQILRLDSDAPQKEIERLKKALPNTKVSV
ncbi:Miro domain-containing protein [Cylindrospermum sp. NIES-4074]|nr:Miro domain-containing protein [Cylindrospermum sp. NIES-4074]